MKLVKTPMTLEQYEAKYPHYQTTLMSFSDKEIKEFNDKFYKNNGNKQIPDKYALLSKHKWVHIKDRYYQVPRVSKLGKAGICVLAAGVVATGAALPFILKPKTEVDVVLTEDEFKANLNYFTDFTNKNRNYSAIFRQNSKSYKTDGDETNFNLKIYGENIKFISLDTKEENVTYYKVKDKKLFKGEKDGEKLNSTSIPESWKRLKDKDDPIYENFGYSFELFNENFDKFTKSSSNTYSVTGLEYEEKLSRNGGGGKYKIDADLTFNADKTLKHVYQIETELEENGGSSTLVTTIDFSEIGSCIFHDLDEVELKQICPLDLEDAQYVYTARSLTKGETINTFVDIVIKEKDSKIIPARYIWLEKTDKSSNEIYPLDKDKEIISIKVNGKDFTDWSITKKYAIDLGDLKWEADDSIEIILQLNNDLDEGGTFYANGTGPSSNF